MDIFDFEELIAEMLNISDDDRESDVFLENAFYEKFGIDLGQAYELARHLILYTPKVKAGLTEKTYHAFVSRKYPMMFMKIEAANND